VKNLVWLAVASLQLYRFPLHLMLHTPVLCRLTETPTAPQVAFGTHGKAAESHDIRLKLGGINFTALSYPIPYTTSLIGEKRKTKIKTDFPKYEINHVKGAYSTS